MLIDARNVLKYKCVHCSEWVDAQEYRRHSYIHYNETQLPTPDSLQDYINRFIPIGLASPEDFELKPQSK
jgi:hypothetical protein